MKVILSTLILISLFSCELHQQETKTQEQRVRADINLKVISTLSKAVTENNLKLIKSTLNSGNYNINVVDENGDLLILKAIRRNRHIIGDFLLKNGADPVVENEEGISAKRLIEGRADEAEWLALFDGQTLSEPFATENLFQILGETKPSSAERLLPVIKGYLDQGALLNGRNRSKFTPLMIAASNGVLKVVEYFCSFDEIDPNVVVKKRRTEVTALYFARQGGFSAVEQALIACGAVK